MSFLGVSSSSGHVIQQPTNPDVFLSFRGIDTRKTFAYHLYKALNRENIKTFFDDRMLKLGDNIYATLLRAIENSKVSVVICSENYGSSKWCLDELVKILECHDSKQQIVFPVFYKVEPAHVRYQIGKFGEAFAGLKALKYGKDKIAGWKEALTQLANLSGLTYVDGYESDFIEEIVKKILDVAGLAQALLPPPPPPPPPPTQTNPRLVQADNPLDRLESRCPPGGRDKIILYTTTLGALWKTKEASNEVRAVLIKLGVKFSERNISWEHEGYLKELRELMKDKGREATVPPRLFVKGKYVGGYEEVFKLVEEDRFRQIVVDFI